MTTKHTPGPWRFGIQTYNEIVSNGIVEKPFDYTGPGYYDNPYIFGADGNYIVGSDEYDIFSSPENTRLIVAAPDLLEALLIAERFVAQFEEEVDYVGGQADTINTIHAAIAKATG